MPPAIDLAVQGSAYNGQPGLAEQSGYPKRAGGSSARSRDLEVARRPWDLSDELTGVSFLF
jgi:hypothetical protein